MEDLPEERSTSKNSEANETGNYEKNYNPPQPTNEIDHTNMDGSMNQMKTLVVKFDLYFFLVDLIVIWIVISF